MLLSKDCRLGCRLGCRFHTIAAPKAQEHATLEEKNMAVIKKVYKRLRADKEVQGRIRQIKYC